MRSGVAHGDGRARGRAGKREAIYVQVVEQALHQEKLALRTVVAARVGAGESMRLGVETNDAKSAAEQLHPAIPLLQAAA